MSAAGRLLPALREAVGSDAVQAHDPIDLEGASPTVSVRPPDGESLAGVVRALAASGSGALLRGGASRLATANAPARAEVILDLRGLLAPPVLELEEGVAWLAAGTPLSQVAVALEGSGWELPLDPPGSDSTVGGALASAAVGPRFGHPRAVTLGLEVTLGSGERTRCGGRVVKNVSGYDLVKLYLGSFGSLAAIEAAWLRLRPAPECVRVGRAPLSWGSLAAALAAARAPTARVAALADRSLLGEPAGDGERLLVVELAGDQAAVEADAAALRESVGLCEGPADLVDRVRDAQGQGGGLRLRIDALPTTLGEAAAELEDAGARLLAFPGRGLLYARRELPGAPDERVLDPVFRAGQRAADRGQGSLCIESAPVSVRAVREVFGTEPGLIPLARELKRRYDPAGVLNPGRFAGGL